MNAIANKRIFCKSIAQSEYGFIKNWTNIAAAGDSLCNLFKRTLISEPRAIFFVKTDPIVPIDIHFVGQTIINIYAWLSNANPNKKVEIKTQTHNEVFFQVGESSFVIFFGMVFSSIKDLMNSFQQGSDSIVLQSQTIHCRADTYKHILEYDNILVKNVPAPKNTSIRAPLPNITLPRLLQTLEENGKRGTCLVPHKNSIEHDGHEWATSPFLIEMRQHLRNVANNYETYTIQLHDDMMSATDGIIFPSDAPQSRPWTVGSKVPHWDESKFPKPGTVVRIMPRGEM
jgi:hypothetical protein